MKPNYVVYEDTVISVGLFAGDLEDDERQLLRVGVRWLPPAPRIARDGELQETTNIMGGETEWFLLPYSFGAAVCRDLVEKKVSGLPSFDPVGYERMVSWLVDNEELRDSMCY